ncbi:MAG: SprT family zinc-dependent metalloprotease [Arenimonas sp.]
MFSFLKPDKPVSSIELWPVVLTSGEAVEIRCVHDARARRLRLIVNEKGVRLTIPKRCSDRLARQFLAENTAWLESQWNNRPHLQRNSDLQLHADETVLLRGSSLPVRWNEAKFAQVSLQDEKIVIALPAKAGLPQAKRALKEFYLQEARKDIGTWMPKYLPAFPTAPLAIKVRALSSLWGSLSPGDGLLLDLSLVLGKPSAFEYVLVHELCHLVHRNHSRSFWREVEKHFPDWRDERRYLHSDGLALKAELQRLTK